MSTEMTQQELEQAYDKLVELKDAGDEQGIKAYLKQQMPRFPEDVRGEILARTYFDALVEEADEIEAIASIQKACLAALEALQKELEEQKGAQGGA